LADGLPACRFIGGQAGRAVCPHRLEACSPIKQPFGEYAEWNVQGALAAMRFEEESDRYAYRNGLWVLRCEDGITGIANATNFQARNF
jgi:hypothetical protein